MNKTLYWVIGLIVIIGLVFGGYKLMKHSKNIGMYNSQATGGNTQGSAGLTNKADTSNQQLDQDLQDVQNSMNKLNADQVQTGQAVSNQSTDTPPQE